MFNNFFIILVLVTLLTGCSGSNGNESSGSTYIASSSSNSSVLSENSSISSSSSNESSSVSSVASSSSSSSVVVIVPPIISSSSSSSLSSISSSSSSSITSSSSSSKSSTSSSSSSSSVSSASSSSSSSSSSSPTNGGLVSITFDDGWASAYNNGIPVFNNAGFPVTAYVITKYLNGLYGYMSTANVLTLAGKGNEIASHTQTHPCLSTIETKLTTPSSDGSVWTHANDCLNIAGNKLATANNAIAQEQEIRGSYNDLISMMGIAPTNFAYPYGDFNLKSEEILKNVGYFSARTVNSWDSISNVNSTNKYELFSRCVEYHPENGQTYNDVADLIIADIDYAIASNSWYVLCLHRVDDSDPANAVENVSSSMLKTVVNHLIATKVKVMTVDEAMRWMK